MPPSKDYTILIIKQARRDLPKRLGRPGPHNDLLYNTALDPRGTIRDCGEYCAEIDGDGHSTFVCRRHGGWCGYDARYLLRWEWETGRGPGIRGGEEAIRSLISRSERWVRPIGVSAHGGRCTDAQLVYRSTVLHPRGNTGSNVLCQASMLSRAMCKPAS